MSGNDLCKQCGRNPINRERSICKCTKCLDAARDGMRKYISTHKESIQARAKTYYATHADERCDYQRAKRKKALAELPDGICKDCCKNPIDYRRSKRSCSSCLDYKKRRRKIDYQTDVKKAQASQTGSMRKKPELYRAIKKKYYESHKDRWTGYAITRRARLANSVGAFTEDEWKSLLNEYGHRCLWCGRKGKLERDHVIPIVYGGSNSIDNIQPLCRSCNSRKHAKIIDFRPFGVAIVDWT